MCTVSLRWSFLLSLPHSIRIHNRMRTAQKKKVCWGLLNFCACLIGITPRNWIIATVTRSTKSLLRVPHRNKLSLFIFEWRRSCYTHFFFLLQWFYSLGMWCSSLPLHTVDMMHRLQHVAIPASDIEQYFINLQDSVMWGWGAGKSARNMPVSWHKFPGDFFPPPAWQNLTFGKVCEEDLFVTASN